MIGWLVVGHMGESWPIGWLASVMVRVLVHDVWCVRRSADGLHMQDIESSLYHSFWSEIPSSRNVFHHRALSALKAYVEVLSKVRCFCLQCA